VINAPAGGGRRSVDAAPHDPRAQSVNDFMFNSGPNDRFVAEAKESGVELIWPGGTSAIPGNPFYMNLLPRYLTNDAAPLLFRPGELRQETVSASVYIPATSASIPAQ
jgi:penicillin amidase